ncbi:MAG TPA: folate-binding protein [Sphingomicrobium sp.]|jgi:folate-binding protein YgfZ|nr:folate-binding protein [Sphingomicrobium sp.]
MPATTLTDRAVIRLSGEDVRGFVQGLVTNDVAGELPVWAGLLTPQGKCLFDFLVWPDDQSSGDDLLLDCEAEAADDLIKRLAIYRLRRPITIARDESISVHWSKDGGDDPRLTALGRRWLGPADEAANGWLEHRLGLGVTEGRAELADILWLECNAIELNGVSFAKGCFVGQENTARMNWRQKVNRRLFVVTGGGGERARVEYPDVGLSVVQARVDAIPANAIVPDWLKDALAQPSTA